MKCPQCRLVHPPGAEVCRRCEIDLKTGESRPRSSFILATPASRPLAERVKAIRKRIPAPRPSEPAPDANKPAVPSAQAMAHERATTEEPKRVIAVFRKPAGLLKRLNLTAPKGELASLTCLQCSGNMTVARQAPFSPGAPFALFAAGALLAVAGLMFHLLFITAAIAIAAGILYLRVGRTYWKCNSCGATIPRFSG